MSWYDHTFTARTTTSVTAPSSSSCSGCTRDDLVGKCSAQAAVGGTWLPDDREADEVHTTRRSGDRDTSRRGAGARRRYISRASRSTTLDRVRRTAANTKIRRPIPANARAHWRRDLVKVEWSGQAHGKGNGRRASTASFKALGTANKATPGTQRLSVHGPGGSRGKVFSARPAAQEDRIPGV